MCTHMVFCIVKFILALDPIDHFTHLLHVSGQAAVDSRRQNRPKVGHHHSVSAHGTADDAHGVSSLPNADIAKRFLGD